MPSAPVAPILFYVQHLVGVGHLVRARLIADALASAGFDVHLVCGGMPVAAGRSARCRVHQLPPVRVDDGDFAVLRDGGGRPIDDAYRSARRDALLGILDAVRPALLIVETFPFGRRGLRFELVPLLERAWGSAPRPLVVASVRDILQQRGGERAREMVETANRWFDAILVHGDPRFARFETSLPLAAALEREVRYTGFVAAPADGDEAGFSAGDGVRSVGGEARARGDVVVSAGGGAAGAALLAAALAARECSRLREARWRLLAGYHVDDATLRRLAADAPSGVVVERARPDFARLLRQAAVSVSQAGYNTMLDVARSGVRAVVVPYTEHGETEQRARASRLAELSLAVVVDETPPSPERLAAAIDAAATRADWGAWSFDDDGAARSAELIAALLAGRA